MSKSNPAPFNIGKHRPPGLVFEKQPGGLFRVHGNVAFTVMDAVSGEIKDHTTGHNIVTADGVAHYNERLAQTIPANDLFTVDGAVTFNGVMELFTGTVSAPAADKTRAELLIGGTSVSATGTAIPQTIDAGYPMLSDPSTNNASGSGPGVLTYRYDWGASEAYSGGLLITNAIICNPSPTVGNPKMLMWSNDFTPFDKTLADSVEAFVNHTLVGV